MGHKQRAPFLLAFNHSTNKCSGFGRVHMSLLPSVPQPTSGLIFLAPRVLKYCWVFLPDSHTPFTETIKICKAANLPQPASLLQVAWEQRQELNNRERDLGRRTQYLTRGWGGVGGLEAKRGSDSNSAPRVAGAARATWRPPQSRSHSGEPRLLLLNVAQIRELHRSDQAWPRCFSSAWNWGRSL